MKVEVFINDGTEVKPGDVANDRRRKSTIVAADRAPDAERHAAYERYRYHDPQVRSDKLVGTHTRVLDTRKTTPGMRILEKMAVKIGGGGVIHRIGLFDMILLKDNHVDFAGGIDKAINSCQGVLQGERARI